MKAGGPLQKPNVVVFQLFGGAEGRIVDSMDFAYNDRNIWNDALPGGKGPHDLRFDLDATDVVGKVPDRDRGNLDHDVGIENHIKALAFAAGGLSDRLYRHVPPPPVVGTPNAKPEANPGIAGVRVQLFDLAAGLRGGFHLHAVKPEKIASHIVELHQPRGNRGGAPFCLSVRARFSPGAGRFAPGPESPNRCDDPRDGQKRQSDQHAGKPAGEERRRTAESFGPHLLGAIAPIAQPASGVFRRQPKSS